MINSAGYATSIRATPTHCAQLISGGDHKITIKADHHKMESLGKHLEFLNEPNNDHLCPVCTEPLIEPYLTDCGHHFCNTCRGRLLASRKAECPECREQEVLTGARLNKHLQRQVNSLKVRCQHHEVGCQWVGELMYFNTGTP